MSAETLRNDEFVCTRCGVVHFWLRRNAKEGGAVQFFMSRALSLRPMNPAAGMYRVLCPNCHHEDDLTIKFARLPPN